MLPEPLRAAQAPAQPEDEVARREGSRPPVVGEVSDAEISSTRPMALGYEANRSHDAALSGVEATCFRSEQHRRGDMLELPRGTGEGHEVWLHVYDLGPVTGQLNEFVLRGANLGAFHCGIEVLGDEWSFQGFHDAWDDPTLSGIVRNEPRLHPAYLYRESVLLGRSPLDEDAIDLLLDRMMEEWPANAYHLVARNCVTFAEEFAKVLQAPEPFPAWVRGAVDACKAPALEAITDYGWSWFKWWSKRQAEQEALAEAEAEAAAAAQMESLRRGIR